MATGVPKNGDTISWTHPKTGKVYVGTYQDGRIIPSDGSYGSYGFNITPVKDGKPVGGATVDIVKSGSGATPVEGSSGAQPTQGVVGFPGQDIYTKGVDLGSNWAGFVEGNATPYPFQTQAWTNPYLTQNLTDMSAGVTAAQGQSVDLGGGNPFRTQQLGFLDTLQKQATGQTPSLAEAQYQAAQDQNLKAALAQQASMRGQNVGLQLRQAQNLRANTAADTARQGALLRMQEQNQNQTLYANALQQGRTGDISSQQTQNQMIQYYTSQGLSLQQAQWQAMMDLEKQKAQQWALAYQTNAGLAGANAQADSRLTGSVLGAIGSLGAAGISMLGGGRSSGGGGGGGTTYDSGGLGSGGDASGY